ncbi:hypothetical protein K440DRAFT_638439 [Wilcoxina mikolae CBS 423.85]|nr:hypothetical protein K440DRAFT_638439 [Wilcoxina mikolae CBS 423.85]
MSRTKFHMHPKRRTPKPQEFVIIGVGSLLAQTRAITRTSKSLTNSIERLASLPIHSAFASASQLETEIEATLSRMAIQISSLKSLAASPFLLPKSAAEPAKDWAKSFESDLLGYRLQFDTVNRGREDGKWVVELFGEFDRGWERGGARLAVGKEEWEYLVEEFLVAQDANEACIGRNNELDWSVIQLVKSQYALSGLGSDVIRTTEVF